MPEVFSRVCHKCDHVKLLIDLLLAQFELNCAQISRKLSLVKLPTNNRNYVMSSLKINRARPGVLGERIFPTVIRNVVRKLSKICQTFFTKRPLSKIQKQKLQPRCTKPDKTNPIVSGSLFQVTNGGFTIGNLSAEPPVLFRCYL